VAYNLNLAASIGMTLHNLLIALLVIILPPQRINLGTSIQPN
jgi:hypothetical protein